jgi:methionyl-tRNA formyltransferase
MPKPRVGFITCVDVGLACIEEIYAIGGTLDAVYTMPEDKGLNISGRVYPEQFCADHQCPLVHTTDINDPQTVSRIAEDQLDWLFVLWSQIAKPPLLESLGLGALCIHPTLLPQGRGRAAIPNTILNGLQRSGVTLFQIDEGMDTGPILAQESFDVVDNETATTLYRKVSQAHRTLIRRVWWSLLDGNLPATPQDNSQASIWQGRKPRDGRLCLEMEVEEVERLVRAVTRPYPGAFLPLRDGSTLRVWGGTPIEAGHEVSAGFPLKLKDGDYLATDFEVEPAEP